MSRAKWVLLGVAGAIAFALGFAGYLHQFSHEPGHRAWSDSAYYTVKLFGFSVEMPATGRLDPALEVARWLAPLVAGFTALAALAVLFRDRIRLSLVGLVWRDHIVVCGLGDKGRAFTESSRAAGRRVAVVTLDASGPHVAAVRALGAVVVGGDARDPATLDLVAAARAGCVVAVCADDGVNAEVALRASALDLEGRRAPLRCFVDLGDPDLALLLAAEESRRAATHSAHAELRYTNTTEAGVRNLVREHPPGTGPGTHALVVGTDDFAGRVVANLARRALADNATGGAADAPAGADTVTVLSPGADRHVRDLRADPTGALPFAIDAVAVGLDALDTRADDLARRAPVTTAYVCTGDDGSGLAAALWLRARVVGPETPVVVVMTSSTGLARLVATDDRRAAAIAATTAFPILERTCTADALELDPLDVLARAQHERYVRDQTARGDTAAANPSLRPWSELSETLRDANRASARSALDKLDRAGCTVVPIRSWTVTGFSFAPAEVEALAREEHDRFVRDRVADGWAFAPGPKDEARRTSPTLVAWEDLGADEQEKDRDVVRGIPLQLAELGWQVVRTGATRG